MLYFEDKGPIGEQYGIGRSTVGGIKKSKENILNFRETWLRWGGGGGGEGGVQKSENGEAG